MLAGRNRELAKVDGNLFQSVPPMMARNCGGAVPEPGAFSDEDREMLAAAEALLPKRRTTMDAQAFHEGLEAIWTVIRAANVYVDRQAPWTLRKTDEARMRTVLYTLAETIRNPALLTPPFMPPASGAIIHPLAVAEAGRSF